MKHYIVCHKDNDGYCSAAIVFYALTHEKGVKPEDIEVFRTNYGEVLELPAKSATDKVYVVDYSLQPDAAMLALIDEYGDNLTWIDHHRTALQFEEANADKVNRVRGLREEGVGACELCWRYFFEDWELPKGVELISRYDVWDRSEPDYWESHIMPLQVGLSGLNMRPDTAQGMSNWIDLIETSMITPGFLQDTVTRGRTLYQFKCTIDDKTVRSYAYEGKFAGHTAVMINHSGNSTMFERVFPTKEYDLLVTYRHYKGKHWTVSLYSYNTDKVNCGELAKKLGEAGPIPSGGGHPGAAGFQTKWEYLESLIEIDD